MIGATAITPSASALHQRSQLSPNETPNVCAAAAPDQRVRGDRATEHEREHVAQPAKREALARDALDEQRAQQPFGAARDGECNAHLERAAGMQVGRQASDPRPACQRGPHVAWGHKHHAQIDAARRPQHQVKVSNDQAGEHGHKEVSARERCGGGNQPHHGGGGPHGAHHVFSVGRWARVL